VTPAILPTAAVTTAPSSATRATQPSETFRDILNEMVPADGANEAATESASQDSPATDARAFDTAIPRPDLATLTALVPDAALPAGEISEAKWEEPSEQSDLTATQPAEILPDISVAQLIAFVTKAAEDEAPQPIGSATAVRTSGRSEQGQWFSTQSQQAAIDVPPAAKNQITLAQLADDIPMVDATSDITTAGAPVPVRAFQPVTSPATAVPDMRPLYLTPDNQWIDRLRSEIVSSAARDNELQFTLKPEHLGRLHIALTTQDGKVDIRLDASTSAAAQILATEQVRLIEDLRHAGVRVGQFEMTNSQNGAHQQQRHRQDAPTSDPQPTPNRNTLAPEKRGRFA